MTIGQLAGAHRTIGADAALYTDACVLPKASRTEAGYRVFAPDAVARARPVRTLRELGVGLGDIGRVLREQALLADVAASHARALETQIRTLRLQRRGAQGGREIHRPRGAETHDRPDHAERRGAPADPRRLPRRGLRRRSERRGRQAGDGRARLPDDPTPDQIAAWVEFVGLLRDPEFVAVSSRMAPRARAESPQPDVAQLRIGRPSASTRGRRRGTGSTRPRRGPGRWSSGSKESAAGDRDDRATGAERCEGFHRPPRRPLRTRSSSTLAPIHGPTQDQVIEAWEWYARALRVH